MTSEIITVLGMHRSGTSAIAKSLPLLGVDLGSNLHPPGFDNPKGFWEDLEVIEINDQLLHVFGSAYDSLILEADYSTENREILRLQEKAIDLLARKTSQHNGVWGFKDPRTCRLLPFWQNIFKKQSYEEKYLIVIRNPLSIVDSLAKRNDFSKCKSLSLWLQHVVPTLVLTKGERRVIIDYDVFISDPIQQLRTISTDLNLEPLDHESESFRVYCTDFLDNTLRHTLYSLEDLIQDNDLPKEVLDTYSLLHKIANVNINLESAEVSKYFKTLNNYLSASSYHFRNFEKLEKDHLRLKQIAGKTSDIVKVGKNNISRQNTIIKTLVAKLTEKTVFLNNEISRQRTLIQEQRGKIQTLEDTIRLNQEKNRRIALDYEEKLKHALDRQRQLEKELCNKEQNLAAIISSKSWKITSPLRSFTNFVRKHRNQVPENLLHSSIDSNLQLNDDLDFDEDFYRQAYPGIEGIEPKKHYQIYGWKEGKLPRPPQLFSIDALDKLDPCKNNVLLVSHDASRTSAPILTYNMAKHLRSKYNIIILPLRSGELLSAFEEISDIVLDPFPEAYNKDMVSAVLGPILKLVTIKFAIVNSIISRAVLHVLAMNFVPSLCLIHELSTCITPREASRQVLLLANRIIFSSKIVFDDHARLCNELISSSACIIPQGTCSILTSDHSMANEEKERLLADQLNNTLRLSEDSLLILGVGTVEFRKGVDLFLSCASRLIELDPDVDFHFVWVGKGYHPEKDLCYSTYLSDQIEKSNIKDKIYFTGNLSSVDGLYEKVDYMFLSSRLDPLPQVVSEGMSYGIPVICFDKLNGWAEIFNKSKILSSCVVPYLNVEKAAEQIIKMVRDDGLRKDISNEVQQLSRESFCIGDYVAELEIVACKSVIEEQREKDDCSIIANENVIAQDFFVSPFANFTSDDEIIRYYVRSWKKNIAARKPFPGFHPGIYAERNGIDLGTEDPLAAFLRAGTPGGNWLYPVFNPSSIDLDDARPSSQRIALHIHCFYVDLLPDIFSRLQNCREKIDILISVPSHDISSEVKDVVKIYTNVRADIRSVPNRGRDIGPMLTEFNQDILDKYDIIGHVHTKKSLDVQNASIINIWNKFLLENLIGGKYAMVSYIMRHFERDKMLGLVFPEDPCVVGWTENKKVARSLASQFGIEHLLTEHFNFPVGTMFWARTEALKPLLTRGFAWDDYPEEPLAYDGTMLHALERLVPFIVKSMGYGQLLTYVPGITR